MRLQRKIADCDPLLLDLTSATLSLIRKSGVEAELPRLSGPRRTSPGIVTSPEHANRRCYSLGHWPAVRRAWEVMLSACRYLRMEGHCRRSLAARGGPRHRAMGPGSGA